MSAMLDALGRDVRHAVRGLRRAPGFTAVAVLTLALGIGANTAVFSIVYGVLVRPLPYHDAGQLVLIQAERDVEGAQKLVRSYFPLAELAEWRARIRAFESIAFYASRAYALSNAEGSTVVDAAVVSDAFFSTIQGPLVAGRGLGPADAATPAVVISQRLGSRLASSSSDAVGRSITLNSQPYTVVGVASAAFQWPSRQTDVWAPAEFTRTLDPRCCGSLPVARVAPGTSMQQAQTDVEAAYQALHAGNPGLYEGVHMRIIGVREEMTGAIEPMLMVLFAAAGLFLLVSCANVTNLLLARHAARRRELATRTALGASRGQLARQSVVESALLGAAGSLLGVLFARGTLDALRRLEPSGLPRLDAVRLDMPVLLFAIAVAAAMTLAAGALPIMAFNMRRQTLGATGGGASGTPYHRSLGRVLVVAELALSVVLLVGAGLLGQSLVRLLRTDIGVVTDNVVTASVNLSLGRTLTDVQQAARTDEILRRVRTLPGIAEAGMGASLPPNASNLVVTLRRTEGVVADYQATAIPCTPGYFKALGMRLVSGRLFADADDETHPAVAIVSVETARRFFPDTEPVGRRITLPLLRNGTPSSVEATVVGVVATVKYSGLDTPPDDAIYRPLAQQPWPSLFLAARTEHDPTRLLSAVRREIAAVDPGIAVSSLGTLDALMSDAVAQPRFRTLVLSSLAGLAVVLAGIGLYGLIAYSVSQRANEIGVRMALGATRGDITAMVMGEGAMLAIAGIAIGLGGAYALGGVLTRLLYGVMPAEAVSFGLAASGVLAVTLVATYVPARRATKIDPLVALRAE